MVAAGRVRRPHNALPWAHHTLRAVRRPSQPRPLPRTLLLPAVVKSKYHGLLGKARGRVVRCALVAQRRGLLAGRHAGGAVGGGRIGAVGAGDAPELDGRHALLDVCQLLKGPCGGAWEGGWR